MGTPNVAAQPPVNQADLISQQRQLQEEGFAQSMAMMNLQREEAKKQEAITALSTIMKNAHDANMTVINNAKG